VSGIRCEISCLTDLRCNRHTKGLCGGVGVGGNRGWGFKAGWGCCGSFVGAGSFSGIILCKVCVNSCTAGIRAGCATCSVWGSRLAAALTAVQIVQSNRHAPMHLCTVNASHDMHLCIGALLNGIICHQAALCSTKLCVCCRGSAQAQKAEL
jgi:hypothetical protein